MNAAMAHSSVRLVRTCWCRFVWVLWSFTTLAASQGALAADDILFTSNREGGPFQLFAMAADGSGARRVTAQAMDAANVAWSPDRSQAVFVSTRNGQPDLYVVNIATGNTRQLTQDAALESTPIWSPDGRAVVYQSFLTGRGVLYIINADGSGQRKLTDSQDHDESDPEFSPDGTRLAYVVPLPRRNSQIRVVDVASGKNKLIGAEPPVGMERLPRWSPSGNHIAYTVFKSERNHIHVMRADGSEKTALTQGEDKQNDPQWSPDGKRLVYLGIPAGSARQSIFSMNADGSDKRKLVGGDTEHFVVRVAADGKRLFFVRFHRSGGQIFSMQPDGSDERQVSNNSGYDSELVLAPAVSSAVTASR
jgi:Tol biopolymer transport system component